MEATVNTETAETAAMRGRFAVYMQEQGFVVAYKTDLCDTCQGCGCGTRQEPLDLTPGGLPKLISKVRKARVLKGMIGL